MDRGGGEEGEGEEGSLSDCKMDICTKKTHAPHIKDSIPSDYVYRSVTDRYFSKRYCLSVGLKNNDHMLLFHSNRICVLCLAPTHPVLRENNLKVDFVVEGVDRAKNEVKGKGKKGGQIFQPDSRICTISSDVGTYPVYSCVKGRLIEVNQQLSDKPTLLQTLTDSDGYIAVILQNIAASETRKEELLSHDDYLKCCMDTNEKSEEKCTI